MSADWTKLVATGRAKDLGVAWNEEELESLVTISQGLKEDFVEVAPYIREHGPLSIEEYQALREGRKDEETRTYLEAEAKRLGIEVSPETPITNLRTLVTKAQDKDTTKNDKKPAKKAAKKTTKKRATKTQ